MLTLPERLYLHFTDGLLETIYLKIEDAENAVQETESLHTVSVVFKREGLQYVYERVVRNELAG